MRPFDLIPKCCSFFLKVLECVFLTLTKCSLCCSILHSALLHCCQRVCYTRVSGPAPVYIPRGDLDLWNLVVGCCTSTGRQCFVLLVPYQSVQFVAGADPTLRRVLDLCLLSWGTRSSGQRWGTRPQRTGCCSQKLRAAAPRRADKVQKQCC